MGIDDLYIKDLEWREEKVITLVKASDPLLRRFGQCDLIQLKTGEGIEIQRQRADEVWSVVRGRAAFALVDLRVDSSSHQAKKTLTLDGRSPQTLLVPFGVFCHIEADQESTLIRLATHEDDDYPEDRTS